MSNGKTRENDFYIICVLNYGGFPASSEEVFACIVNELIGEEKEPRGRFLQVLPLWRGVPENLGSAERLAMEEVFAVYLSCGARGGGW